MIVAIDGPAGSGKSTTARAVADKLGFEYLDTGAMYRAVALHLLRLGADKETVDLVDALQSFRLDLSTSIERPRVLLDGVDVTEEIRSPEVASMASRISGNSAVRSLMVERQRAVARSIASSGGVVVEGRDIGTVVFPDADLKVFMQARDGIRVGRRLDELRGRGHNVSADDVARDLAERDARDRERTLAPLMRADDALVVDTSDLTFDEQVAMVVGAVKALRSRGLGNPQDN